MPKGSFFGALERNISAFVLVAFDTTPDAWAPTRAGKALEAARGLVERLTFLFPLEGSEVDTDQARTGPIPPRAETVAVSARVFSSRLCRASKGVSESHADATNSRA